MGLGFLPTFNIISKTPESRGNSIDRYDLTLISVVTMEHGKENALGLQINNCYHSPAQLLEDH